MSDEKKNETCRCPYCDGPVEPAPPFCQPCQKEFKICEGCGKPVPKEAEYCPHCNPQD